jgi:hypothetical protein
MSDDVSEEYAASMFRVEDGENIFLWKSIIIYWTTQRLTSEKNKPNIHHREDI